MTVSAVSHRIRRIKDSFKRTTLTASEDPTNPTSTPKRRRGPRKADSNSNANANGEPASKKTKVEKDGVDEDEAATA